MPKVLDADEDIAGLAKNSLAGDIRDFILDKLKHDHSALPWHLRGEADQGRYIEAADAEARRLVAAVARLVATRGRECIAATVKKAAVRDVVAVELHVAASHPLRHQLLDCVGAEILVVISGLPEFLGDRGKPEITRDQATMFDGEDA